jgi:hypothetical protein
LGRKFGDFVPAEQKSAENFRFLYLGCPVGGVIVAFCESDLKNSGKFVGFVPEKGAWVYSGKILCGEMGIILGQVADFAGFEGTCGKLVGRRGIFPHVTRGGLCAWGGVHLCALLCTTLGGVSCGTAQVHVVKPEGHVPGATFLCSDCVLFRDCGKLEISQGQGHDLRLFPGREN